jgi:hypothetical protein
MKPPENAASVVTSEDIRILARASRIMNVVKEVMQDFRSREQEYQDIESLSTLEDAGIESIVHGATDAQLQAKPHYHVEALTRLLRAKYPELYKARNKNTGQ